MAGGYRCDMCGYTEDNHIDSGHGFYSRDEQRAALESARSRVTALERENAELRDAVTALTEALNVLNDYPMAPSRILDEARAKLRAARQSPTS